MSSNHLVGRESDNSAAPKFESVLDLPFVKLTKGRRGPKDQWWAVKSTGTFSGDAELGGAHGLAYLEFLSQIPMDMSITRIAAEQARADWGAVSAFWTPILAAALDAYRRDPQRYARMVAESVKNYRNYEADEHARRSTAARRGHAKRAA